MTGPTNIHALIFGHDTAPQTCAQCAGIGLIGIGANELPALCVCGGSGYGNVLAPEPADDPRQLRLDLGREPAPEDDDFAPDPSWQARCRARLTDADLDQAADNLMAAIDEALREMNDRTG